MKSNKELNQMSAVDRFPIAQFIFSGYSLSSSLHQMCCVRRRFVVILNAVVRTNILCFVRGATRLKYSKLWREPACVFDLVQQIRSWYCSSDFRKLSQQTVLILSLDFQIASFERWALFRGFSCLRFCILPAATSLSITLLSVGQLTTMTGASL
jgi:hypothetical protein